MSALILVRRAVLAFGLAGAVAVAAPFTPSSDAQVLATVPARALDPGARELFALRQAWQRSPRDLDAALAYARRCLAQVAADGDPRSVGHAQAAMAPWFDLADPPPPVRLLRAQVLQFDHRFDAALADLDALLRVQPDAAEAWAWRAAIQMVRADDAEARRSCAALAPLAPPLVALACRAQVDAATGRAAAAADALRGALAAAPEAGADTRLWVLTRLAETEERRGAWPAAEAAFRSALALGRADARILLEAALAARQRAAAQPVLDWMAASGIESVVLHGLAARLQALR